MLQGSEPAPTQASLITFQIEQGVLDYISALISQPESAKQLLQEHQVALASATNTLSETLSDLALLQNELQGYQQQYNHCIAPIVQSPQPIINHPLAPQTQADAETQIESIQAIQHQLVGAYRKSNPNDVSALEKNTSDFRTLLIEEYTVLQNVNTYKESLQSIGVELAQYQWIQNTEALLQNQPYTLVALSKQSATYCGFYANAENDPNNRTRTLNERLENNFIETLRQNLSTAKTDNDKLRIIVNILHNVEIVTDKSPMNQGSLNLRNQLHSEIVQHIRQCEDMPDCHSLLLQYQERIKRCLGIDLVQSQYLSDARVYTPGKDTPKPDAPQGAPGASSSNTKPSYQFD